MLNEEFSVGRTSKRTDTREPFVDHDAQSILITGRAGFTVNLLGGHVIRSANSLLQAERTRIGESEREVKVAEPDLMIRPQKHVTWLHIAMNDSPVMGIL
jgi:hypothetical protein